MVRIKNSSTYIEVYYRDKIVLEVVDKEFGIEVYDFVNHEYIPVISFWLNGAFEEIETFLNSLLERLETNPENIKDSERKDVLNNILNRIKKEIWE